MLLKAVIFLLFSLSIVSALTTRWLGLTGDPHWHNPSNWYCADITRNCTPTSIDFVIIESNPSCVTCVRDIIIGPNLTADCFSLTVNASSSLPISITVQSGLSVVNSAYLSNNTRLVVIRFVRLQGGFNANFTSRGAVVLDGGSLTGNTFYLNNVTIPSTGQILTGYVNNIYFRPVTSNLICALVNSNVKVNGSIISTSSLNLSGGDITTSQFIFNPLRNNYTLNIMANLMVDNGSLAGNVSTMSGNTYFAVLWLNNTDFVVWSTGRFPNVTGNGTFTVALDTAVVQANAYDENIHFTANYGTLNVGGKHCGKIIIGQYSGYYPVLNLNEGVIIRNATFLGGAIQQFSPKVNASAWHLTIGSPTFFPINFHVLNQSFVSPNNGFLSLNSNAYLIINTRAALKQNYTLSIGGYGQVVNNGTWEVNGNGTTLSGGFTGNGSMIVNSGYVNLVLPANVTNNITLLNGGTLHTSSNAGRWFINSIHGAVNKSNVYLNGDYVYIKNITVNNLADWAQTTVIERFNIHNYSIDWNLISFKNTNLTEGTIRHLHSLTGNFRINLGPKVNITNATISELNRLSFSPTTNVTNLYWVGGTIAQTGSNGIFRITNSTYFINNIPKFIESNTVLHTKFLDCTRCITPGCGLRVTDWNHIVAEKTFGCIIF